MERRGALAPSPAGFRPAASAYGVNERLAGPLLRPSRHGATERHPLRPVSNLSGHEATPPRRQRQRRFETSGGTKKQAPKEERAAEMATCCRYPTTTCHLARACRECIRSAICPVDAFSIRLPPSVPVFVGTRGDYSRTRCGCSWVTSFRYDPTSRRSAGT